jgi:hypothetical protein
MIERVTGETPPRYFTSSAAPHRRRRTGNTIIPAFELQNSAGVVSPAAAPWRRPRAIAFQN